MKFNVKKAVKPIARFIKANSPKILIGVGIAGGISAVVTAVGATPKALRLIEEEKKARETDKLTPIETVKVAWKCYIPTAATLVLSAGCIIGAEYINEKRMDTLAATCALVERSYSEYRRKVRETVGDDGADHIEDELATEKGSKASEHDVYNTGKGTKLCYDSLSGRYFLSDDVAIQKAVNDFNADLINDGEKTLNDLYYEMNLPSVGVGNLLGWRYAGYRDTLAKIRFVGELDEDNTPCIKLVYSVRPEYLELVHAR